MYESPIKIYVQNMETQLRQQQEQAIFEAVSKYGVAVDKEELIKALNYDRNQYKEGYKDGINAILDKLWKEVSELNPFNYGPARSIDFYETAKEMQIHVLKIIDALR